jgi:hypothetical protein
MPQMVVKNVHTVKNITGPKNLRRVRFLTRKANMEKLSWEKDIIKKKAFDLNDEQYSYSYALAMHYLEGNESDVFANIGYDKSLLDSVLTELNPIEHEDFIKKYNAFMKKAEKTRNKNK